MIARNTPSRSLKYGVLAAFFLTCNQPAVGAGQAHVHGHGKLLIAQEGTHWQLEFTLPAADMVGVEHAAHSEQDKARLHDIAESLASPANVFTTKGGDCQIAEQEVNLPGVGHHEDEHEHEAHSEHEASHADVSLQYQLQCSGDLQSLTVRLFELAPSLGEIEAQWIVNAGQGQTELSPSKRELVW